MESVKFMGMISWTYGALGRQLPACCPSDSVGLRDQCALPTEDPDLRAGGSSWLRRRTSHEDAATHPRRDAESAHSPAGLLPSSSCVWWVPRHQEPRELVDPRRSERTPGRADLDI